MRRRPLLFGSCVFVTGILFARYGSWYYPVIAVILLIYGIEKLLREKHRKRTAIRVLWLTGMFFLAWFHMNRELLVRENELSRIHAGEEILLRGEIYKKEYKNGQYVFYLRECTAAVSTESTETIICNQVIAYLEADSYSIGETLVLKGKVNIFNSASNDGQFDIRAFYESQKIDFSLKNVSVIRTDGKKNSIAECMYRLRERMNAVYEASLDYAKESVLSVMLLGEKAGLDSSIRELYQSTGISHILAISGLHVSMIGMGLYRFLRHRGKSYAGAFIVSFVFLCLYASMTGNSVSTLRAVGMLCFSMFAGVLGRSYDPLNALGGMVILLLWENPFWLWHSGFQFSVVAILGVTVVGKFLQVEKEEDGKSGAVQEAEPENRVCSNDAKNAKVPNQLDAGRKARKSLDGKCTGKEIDMQNPKQSGTAKTELEKITVKAGMGIERKRRLKKESVGNRIYASIAVWMTTLPLVAFYYFEIPIYAVWLNMLVLPLLPILFGCGIAGGLIGCIWLPVAKILLFPCNIILSIYDFLALAVLKLPFSKIIVGRPSAARIIIVYLLIIGLAWICYRNRRGHLRRILGITVILVVVFWPVRHEFEVDVLDVGQGDGIYLCSENGVSMFIDGGSTGIGSVGTYRILPFLKSKGVSHISYWFVSHADTDHISGLLEVIESGYQIDYLVVAEAALEVPREELPEESLEESPEELPEEVYEETGTFEKSEKVKESASEPAPEMAGKMSKNSDEVSEAEASDLLTAPENIRDMDSLAAFAKSYGIEVIAIQEGDRFVFGEDRFTCLYPSADISSEDKNDLSLVMLYEGRRFTGIFTGDISSEVEKDILNNLVQGVSEQEASEQEDNQTTIFSASEDAKNQEEKKMLGIDFYKAAHHGSKYSNSAEFLSALSPEIAVISCSSTNNYGHPSKEAVSNIENAGAKIYYTMQGGRIRVRIEDGELVVEEYVKKE